MDFTSALIQTALENEKQKERSEFERRLKEKSQEAPTKRFSSSKSSASKKRKSRSNTCKSNTPMTPIPKRQRPLNIQTAPINAKTNLQSLASIKTETITPYKGGNLLRPDDEDGKVSVRVKGVQYEAAAIHAFEEDGVLVLRLYARVLASDDLIAPPKLSDSFVTVKF